MSVNKLIYVHDPMCSWCWGYKPTWQKLEAALVNILPIEYRVGGLAADSDQPMSADMQLQLQGIWQNISNQLGTEFNFNFWRECQPRRSTYPSCRAALIARGFNKEPQMIAAIQQAYYLQAQNPSDEDVLIKLSEKIGLDASLFAQHLHSNELKRRFDDELNYVRSLPIQGFPSLVLIKNNRAYPIAINYTDWRQTLIEIQSYL
ncbi:DsbA family protein [Pseudoalteromonas sp.]|uniref:DsbA family protein n=1 Tax=Pseudoalteromonas sp. TaxID=53249 RepID=UPI003569BD61